MQPIRTAVVPDETVFVDERLAAIGVDACGMGLAYLVECRPGDYYPALFERSSRRACRLVLSERSRALSAAHPVDAELHRDARRPIMSPPPAGAESVELGAASSSHTVDELLGHAERQLCQVARHGWGCALVRRFQAGTMPPLVDGMSVTAGRSVTIRNGSREAEDGFLALWTMKGEAGEYARFQDAAPENEQERLDAQAFVRKFSAGQPAPHNGFVRWLEREVSMLSVTREHDAVVWEVVQTEAKTGERTKVIYLLREFEGTLYVLYSREPVAGGEARVGVASFSRLIHTDAL